MIKAIRVLLAVAILSPFGLQLSRCHAQTDVDFNPEFGGRLSLSVDKKLVRGLHLSLEEELRFDGNFNTFDRFHTTLGLSYKVNDYLRFGVGYAMINLYDNAGGVFKSVRHRLMLDATGSVRFGSWRLSLKERFQATCRTGEMNEYQNPRTALTLKSRLKLSYKGLRSAEPYAYVELRNTFNAPVINAVYDSVGSCWGYYSGETFYTKGDPGWFLDGFTGCYINRLRCAIGIDYRLSRRSYVDVCLMADFCTDEEVDASGKGKYLHSYTREKGFKGWLTAGYTYAF